MPGKSEVGNSNNCVGILKSLDVTASDENNLWGLSVTIAYATAIWVVVAIPWFIFEKHRPGQKVPAGMNLVSVGFWVPFLLSPYSIAL